MWLQHRRSDPETAAIVYQCMGVSIHCRVIRPASCQSTVRLATTVWLFGLSPIHLQCQQSLCLIHPSVRSTFLAHIVNPNDTNRRLDGCKGTHHTRSLNCAKEGTARHPTFLSCAVLPSRPTENRRCMLVAYDTSHVNRSWSAGTSTPEADSTANLIDLGEA